MAGALVPGLALMSVCGPGLAPAPGTVGRAVACLPVISLQLQCSYGCNRAISECSAVVLSTCFQVKR